jgi:hypothetical protein
MTWTNDPTGAPTACGESGTFYRILRCTTGYWLESGDMRKPGYRYAVGRKAKTVRYLKQVSERLELIRQRKLNERIPGYIKPT